MNEPCKEFDQLSMPMDQVILALRQQAAELQAYKAKFGNLSTEDFDPTDITEETTWSVRDPMKQIT
jgi:hypothetical protein